MVRLGPAVRIRRVDDDGVSLLVGDDRPVDVCFDGRRVWTFWSRRDSDPVGADWIRGPWPLRHAAWPKPLRGHLNGSSRVSVRDSVTGRVLHDRRLTLGDGEGTIAVENRRGVELGIDKSGRLVPTFATRTERDIDALLDATDAVLAALRETGVEPFIAYGTLLGAVREGRVLGHDSDADLGYVSRFTTPVEVALESYRIQRHLAERGYAIARYSGASFKISVTEEDVTRGLDVFGGFFDGGRLHLMGEINTPFEPSWISPLGTALLDGRPMPVPARPEKLLEAMYGPGWQVPDPAFKFTTPAHTIRAFDDWFRGTQPGIRYWDRRSHHTKRKPPRAEPSALGRRASVIARDIGATEVLDVGAGRGRDSIWLARQGLAVTAYDYVPRGLDLVAAQAEAESLPLEVRHLNLTDRRSLFAEGARLAHRPGKRVVLARHVVDATSSHGRESLARLCSMALREGGQLLAEFHPAVVERGEPDPTREEWMLGRPDVDVFVALLRDAGARNVRVIHRKGPARPVVRVVGVW
ncbi:methyltransferase domain-containing protein [Nocardioides sp. 1609]|uniref:methyltransferase domain-containing protein n=1 Tax=Nocardioides sp. 1609 TaxID=2508327 RepID=UPI001070687A|nr:methyltransferase domain-containing protein [Nocardioides sp. 1609]